MSDRSTQVRGLGNCAEIDPGGSASARRKQRTGNSGAFHLHNRSATNLLVYKTGTSSVDVTDLDDCDGFVAPGQSFIVVCDDEYISVNEVTPAQDCVIGEVA